MPESQWQQLPKAELHVHLEGSMRLERVLALAAEQPDHAFHGKSLAQLNDQFRTRSFEDFLGQFVQGYRLLREQRHFQVVCEELLADLSLQGVTHAHILYSPGVYTQKLAVPLKAIHDGLEAALAHFPSLQVRMVLDTVLNMGLAFMHQTLEAVLADRRPFLGGFSVGGGDPQLAMEPFLPLFERAARAGLFCVAHVGEVDGPANIDTLVRETDLLRIAHGCRAVESAATMALLQRRQIVVDVCPSSNLRTGVVARLEDHPLRSFHEAGIAYTLNTDDPLYFQTDLAREYHLAKELLGQDEDYLIQQAQASLAAWHRAEAEIR